MMSYQEDPPNPIPPQYCLAVLSHYLANVTTTANDECSALRLAYDTVCTRLPSPDLPTGFHTHTLPSHSPFSADYFAPTDDDDLTPTIECCKVIHKTYTSRCNDAENGQLTDQRLLLTVATIALCLCVKEFITARKWRYLPGAAGCILVGMAGGYLVQFLETFSFEFDEKLFLRVLLPPICFEAAMQINKQAFRRHIGPVLTFALLGTLISTVVCGVILKYSSVYAELRDIKGDLMGDNGGLPWAESLCFGALISSIDPIAILAVMNSLGVSDTSTLYILVFGESMLNDGVAVVLFDTITDFMREDVEFDPTDLLWAILTFLEIFCGSCVVGFLCGMLCTLYFRHMDKKQQPLSEVLIFFIFALIPYYICDGWGWSGITSILIAGVTMDVYALQHLSNGAKVHVMFFVETISMLTESAIFAYLGLFMFTATYKWNGVLVSVSVAAMLVSRGAQICVCSFLINKLPACKCAWRLMRERTRDPGTGDADDAGGRISEDSSDKAGQYNGFVSGKNMFIMWFAGLRGGISFALVENIPRFDIITQTGSRFKPELEACTSTCIMFSIFVFGGGTHSMLEYLGVVGTGGQEEGGGNELGLLDVLIRRTTGSSANMLALDANDESLHGADVSLLAEGGVLTDDGLLRDSSIVREEHFRTEDTTTNRSSV